MSTVRGNNGKLLIFSFSSRIKSANGNCPCIHRNRVSTTFQQYLKRERRWNRYNIIIHGIPSRQHSCRVFCSAVYAYTHSARVTVITQYLMNVKIYLFIVFFAERWMRCGAAFICFLFNFDGECNGRCTRRELNRIWIDSNVRSFAQMRYSKRAQRHLCSIVEMQMRLPSKTVCRVWNRWCETVALEPKPTGEPLVRFVIILLTKINSNCLLCRSRTTVQTQHFRRSNAAMEDIWKFQR